MRSSLGTTALRLAHFAWGRSSVPFPLRPLVVIHDFGRWVEASVTAVNPMDGTHGTVSKLLRLQVQFRNEAHAVSQPNSRITFHSSQSVRIAATVLLFILVCTTGCSRDPRAQEMHFLQSGKRLVEKKDYPRALLEFKNAARFVPHDAEPYYQIALAYLASGDAQAAVNNLMHASRLDPKHVGVRLKLTELMAANQDRSVVEEGEKRAQSLFKQLPGNAEAANALGLAELRLGKTDSALAHFQRAMADSPGYLSSAINLALAKMASGNAREAENILNALPIRTRVIRMQKSRSAAFTSLWAAHWRRRARFSRQSTWTGRPFRP
jgi:tetratricopeptide (TPR) repeat protein